MILSDRDIREYIKRGEIKIVPCDLKEQLQPIGVDLRLGNTFKIFKITHKSHIDLAAKNYEPDTETIEVADGKSFVLHPDEFVLGITKEYVEIPNDIMAHIDGRSSLGRLGIGVHSTAGHADPGWKGRLTLEISNIGKLPISIIPGMRFCCLIFETLSSPVEKGYRGKYFRTTSPSTSKISEEFNERK
ncbi:MAG: dCTP deaminase [Candidatus Marsarchaeota archaeon]|jgi:dCTP deaminase|nr:dCTP deaminase [Candidatus Marsarchaeota archaeon]